MKQVKITETAPKTIFCDIDGTLIKHPNHDGKQRLFKIPKPTHEAEALPGTLDKLWDWESKGYNIILTTGRKESMRSETEKQLKEIGLFWDQLVMGLGSGRRYVINDLEPGTEANTANAINLERDAGIGTIEEL
tara:strand:+ start:262 stop:663 length:402 start_codon:yes stop_codon:yes gene_type:complete